MKKILLNNVVILFTKRKGQKNIRLTKNGAGEIVLSAPFFCSEKKAFEFAQKNIEWIEKHSIKDNKLLFKPLDVISIVGKEYQIIHDSSHKSGLKISNNQLITGADESFIHRRVVNYAKKELLAYIKQKINIFSPLIDKKPKNIFLKNTTSRWGSCSSNGNINFCWKIAFAPTFVIDYLIAHELSHLKEMNHSSKFWETVALFNVNQAEAEIWLRKNGNKLIQIN